MEKTIIIRNLSDEQVEQKIRELQGSEYVKLARRKERVDYARRRLLSDLLRYEKRGRELAAAGVTLESLYPDKEPEEPENSDW